ncbi:hypothetical protein BKA83DRAFT_4128954 [Pisolithus microcarpus]|nr:hypothetical protein BKA83DRAFT_4128954 [Pisolithus microcarpus]
MHHASDNPIISSSAPSPAAQLPSATVNPSLVSSDNHTSVHMPCPPDPSTVSASTNQLPNCCSGLNEPASAMTSQVTNMPSSVPSSSLSIQVEPGLLGSWSLFVPPPLALHCCPPHTKGLYLPAPLPVFILLGHQCLAQDPRATPHHHHHPAACKPDIFDHVNEFQFNDEVGLPSGLEEVEISYCACTPAPIHLMECGLFACSPVAPTLAVDLCVLEFMRRLFVWLTPNTTAWCEALESFLDAQGYQLKSKQCKSNAYHWYTVLTIHAEDHITGLVHSPKSLSNKEPGFNQVTTYVPIVPYVLVEVGPRGLMLTRKKVKAMELFIEKQRSLPPSHHDSSHKLQGDSFEDGMRVPMSVLDGCGDSFHAADENCHKWKLLDEEVLSRLKFGISVFHAYGHQWPCQIALACQMVRGYHQRLFVLDNQICHFDRKAFAALGQWLNKKWTLCKSKKMVALESLHALHIDMKTLQEEWAAQDYQSHVDQLEMELVNDHVNDIMDFDLQRTAARSLLSKATKALQQKKSALGVSAQTDLYLLRNNRECLRQCKFELEHLEGSSRNSANAPPGAIPPLPIPTKGIFQLDVDSDIWQDSGSGEGSSEPPNWLADAGVHKGIRLMLEVDQCNEEERRLSREQSVLQEWFSMEWQNLQRALENAAEYYKYHLQLHSHTLLAVYLDWEAKVQHIPHAWVPSRNWGPTGEDVANFVAPASHDPSVMEGAEHPTDNLSEDYEFDAVGALSEGDDELLLGMEEMLLEGECNMGESDEEEITDDEEWLEDTGNGYLPSSPVKLPTKRCRY